MTVHQILIQKIRSTHYESISELKNTTSPIKTQKKKTQSYDEQDRNKHLKKKTTKRKMKNTYLATMPRTEWL